MLGFIKSFIRFVRRKIGIVEYRKVAETVPEDWVNVDETLKIERAALKAKLAKMERENIRLKDQLESIRAKKPKFDVKKEAEKRANEMKEHRKKFMISLTRYAEKDVRVLARYANENEPIMLGYFFDIYTREGRFVIVCSESPFGGGRKYTVWESHTLDGLIHNSHLITQQLESKILILNRDWLGRFIPDIEVSIPIAEPIAEEAIPSKKK